MSSRVTRRGEPCLETVKVQMMLVEVPSTLTPIGTRSATLDIGLAPASRFLSSHGPAVAAAAAAAAAATAAAAAAATATGPAPEDAAASSCWTSTPTA